MKTYSVHKIDRKTGQPVYPAVASFSTECAVYNYLVSLGKVDRWIKTTGYTTLWYYAKQRRVFTVSEMLYATAIHVADEWYTIHR